jgi:hypothetical protein
MKSAQNGKSQHAEFLIKAPVAQWIEQWIPNRFTGFFGFSNFLSSCIHSVFLRRFGFRLVNFVKI